MGQCMTQKSASGTGSKVYSVASLNYSGILNSPFQFFSEELFKEEEKLSSKFERNLKTHIENYNKENFKWGLGKIDQKMQRQRYTPIYDPKVGLVNGKLITKQEFMKLWDQKFDENVKHIKNLQYNQKQKANARKFDYFCYKTIVEYVYNIVEFQKAQVSKLDPSQYEKLMKTFYSKSFLNQQRKMEKTAQAMKKNVDIFFFQQANKKFIQSIDRNTFYVVSDEKIQSIIAIRKDSFPKQKLQDTNQMMQHFNQDFRKQLNWNEDSIMAFIGNFILISGHLSSKSDKNHIQVQKMKQSLQKLNSLYPEKCIIVGADVNSYLSDAPKEFMAFPRIFTDHTTIKTRTFLQPQVNKALVNASSCRDHLITNNIFFDEYVQTIKGKSWKEVSHLPCQQHPYDHFVVVAKVTIKPKQNQQQNKSKK